MALTIKQWITNFSVKQNSGLGVTNELSCVKRIYRIVLGEKFFR